MCRADSGHPPSACRQVCSVPRTKTLEQVQNEYETQLNSGITRMDDVVKAGNPRYVLSVISRKVATGTRFSAAIIDLALEFQPMGLVSGITA